MDWIDVAGTLLALFTGLGTIIYLTIFEGTDV